MSRARRLIRPRPGDGGTAGRGPSTFGTSSPCGGRGPACFSAERVRNRYVWATVGFCVLLLFGAVYIPGVAGVLEVQPPSAEAWGVIALMSLVPLGVGQVVLLVRRYLNNPSSAPHRPGGRF